MILLYITKNALKETQYELLYLNNYMTLDKKKQSLIILTEERQNDYHSLWSSQTELMLTHTNTHTLAHTTHTVCCTHFRLSERERALRHIWSLPPRRLVILNYAFNCTSEEKSERMRAFLTPTHHACARSFLWQNKVVR